jgi:hypothetical protein
MAMTIDRPKASRGRASLRIGRGTAALLCAAAALTAAPGARAQAQTPIDKARMTEDMHAYFHGEKWEGPLFFGAGLAAGGVGAGLLTRGDELARGAAYPLFGIGLVQLIVGAVVFLKTDAQVARLDRQLATDSDGFKKAEGARIKGVNTEFIVLAIIESALIAGGSLTAIVAAQNECCRTLQGIGLGLAGQGAVTLALDLFAAKRALDYTDSLRRFDAGSPAALSPRQPAPLGLGPISVRWSF